MSTRNNEDDWCAETAVLDEQELREGPDYDPDATAVLDEDRDPRQPKPS
jgi:hypothetical protein